VYGETQHPIHGEVTAYMLKSEPGRFVMRVNTQTSREQLQLFRKVGEAKNPKLLTYFGSEAEAVGAGGEGVVAPSPEFP
jgi:hypothetical protein